MSSTCIKSCSTVARLGLYEPLRHGVTTATIQIPRSNNSIVNTINNLIHVTAKHP